MPGARVKKEEGREGQLCLPGGDGPGAGAAMATEMECICIQQQPPNPNTHRSQSIYTAVV